MDEIWRDVYFWENGVLYDYCGLYQVSTHGRVKSLGNGNSNNSKERILKAVKNTYGYNHVILSKDGRRKQFTIHRLVAFMFLSESYFKNAQVNHKDENKTNNHVENLEWCTIAYNNNYGTRNERANESKKGKTFSEEHKKKISEAKKGELVARYDLNMNLIDVKYNFEYRVMGFNTGGIYSCCKGRYKQHKGFIFRYLSDVPDDVINSYIIRTKQIPIR